MLTKQDKKDIREIFNEGFVELVLPHIDELKSEVADLKAGQQRLEDGQDAMGKRQEAEQDMLDAHDKDIEALKKQYPLAA